MALPRTISNGQIPDATRLMENFTYLADGKGIKVATYAELKAFASLAPTVPFDCWATDIKQRMFYTGDITDGDEGFITLG